MKKSNAKLEAITSKTLIVGVDIAKELHWARFTDYRGLELGKDIKFQNDKSNFDCILASIETICKLKNLDKVIQVWSQQVITGNPWPII